MLLIVQLTFGRNFTSFFVQCFDLSHLILRRQFLQVIFVYGMHDNSMRIFNHLFMVAAVRIVAMSKWPRTNKSLYLYVCRFALCNSTLFIWLLVSLYIRTQQILWCITQNFSVRPLTAIDVHRFRLVLMNFKNRNETCLQYSFR